MAETPDPTKSWVLGEWYLVLRCKACNERFVLGHDKDSKVAGGGVRLSIKDEGAMSIVCPSCKETRAYTRAEIKTVQAE